MSPPDELSAAPPPIAAPRRLAAFPGGAAGGAGVLVVDPASGRIVLADAAACQIFGYELAPLLACTVDDLEAAPPAGGETLRHRIARAAGDSPQQFAWQARAADGRCFPATLALSALRGATAEQVCLTMQVGEVVRPSAPPQPVAASPADHGDERFRLLLGRLPTLAVQGCRLDGTVCYWNEASERLYGYSAAEAVGRPLVPLLAPPPLREPLRVALHQMLATGRALPPTEYRFERKDGRSVTVFSSHVVLAPAGAAPEVYRFDFDLSDRERAEGERLELERRLLHRQKLESLGALAGGIAHDFNNLLTGILGNLELVRSELPDTAARPLVDGAITAARRASHLTEQMLAYAGHSPFHQQPTDLNAVVRGQLHLLHAATAAAAGLQLALDPDLPPVEADDGQIGQLLVNLVTNAAEAIDHRPGTVEVRTGREDDCPTERLAASRLPEKPPPQPFAFIEVSDTGGGMDEATVERVFDPFFSTKFAGRGLGLPVVLGIVRAHRGALFVDSRPGRGSTIRVLLPLAHAAFPCPNIDHGTAAGAGGELLLVVAPEEPVRRLAVGVGQELGLEVVAVPDTATAVALGRLHAGTIACAIIDGSLPGPGGAAACREALHQLQPELPALLLAGRDAAPASAGFAASIQKPFTAGRLAAVLRTLAARSAQP